MLLRKHVLMSLAAAMTFAFHVPARAGTVANFTGHWVGKGKIKSNVGVNGDCTVIDVTIQQTDTDFVIQNYHGACGVDDSAWGPNTMHIQGADVIENDEKVGSINDSAIQSASPDGGVIYVFNMQKVPNADGSTAVLCTYGTQNFMGQISIEGELTKVP